MSSFPNTIVRHTTPHHTTAHHNGKQSTNPPQPSPSTNHSSKLNRVNHHRHPKYSATQYSATITTHLPQKIAQTTTNIGHSHSHNHTQSYSHSHNHTQSYCKHWFSLYQVHPKWHTQELQLCKNHIEPNKKINHPYNQTIHHAEIEFEPRQIKTLTRVLGRKKRNKNKTESRILATATPSPSSLPGGSNPSHSEPFLPPTTNMGFLPWVETN